MDVPKRLTELFEFQRFEKDATLQSIIDESEKRYFGIQLPDTDLSILSAAGDPYTQITEPKKREKKP